MKNETMYLYEPNDILTMCSRDHRLVRGLAHKAGILTRALKKAGGTTHKVAGLASQAVSDKSLYTVTLAKHLPDNTLRHEVILITPNGGEALQRRNELNESRLVEGSREVAQVTRREILPRRWKLWQQVSPGEVHLRCEWTKARALLRAPEAGLMKDLHAGRTLDQDRTVFLQGEQVEFTMETLSTRTVSFSRKGGPVITQTAEIRTPVVCYLDVNEASELVSDTRSGVVARHPIRDDKLTLPERFAKMLWHEGIVLPLQIVTNGKVLVRLTDKELRARLELSRFRPAVQPASSTRRLLFRSKDMASKKIYATPL